MPTNSTEAQERAAAAQRVANAVTGNDNIFDEDVMLPEVEIVAERPDKFGTLPQAINNYSELKPLSVKVPKQQFNPLDNVVTSKQGIDNLNWVLNTSFPNAPKINYPKYTAERDNTRTPNLIDDELITGYSLSISDKLFIESGLLICVILFGGYSNAFTNAQAVISELKLASETDYVRDYLIKSSARKTAAILLYEFLTGTGPKAQVLNQNTDFAKKWNENNEKVNEAITQLKISLTKDKINIDDFLSKPMPGGVPTDDGKYFSNNAVGSYKFSPNEESFISSFVKHKEAIGDVLENNPTDIIIGGTEIYFKDHNSDSITIQFVNPMSRSSFKLKMSSNFNTQYNRANPLVTKYHIIEYTMPKSEIKKIYDSLP